MHNGLIKARTRWARGSSDSSSPSRARFGTYTRQVSVTNHVSTKQTNATLWRSPHAPRQGAGFTIGSISPLVLSHFSKYATRLRHTLPRRIAWQIVTARTYKGHMRRSDAWSVAATVECSVQP
jgi:hypothetical protein